MPAQFGDRTAGIIDVTTKTGSQLNGNELSMYGGSYDTIHPSLSLGGTTSNLDYFVTASYLHNDVGIDNTTPGPDPLHDETDQEKLFGYFSHRFDDNQPADIAAERFVRGFPNSQHGGTLADLPVDEQPAGRFVHHQ
jgi:outer membrane cobalamin receptor